MIAYDFLYNLLVRKQVFLPKEERFAVESDTFAKSCQENLQGFFSFGSPIGLFMLRNPEAYANNFAQLKNPLDGKKWLNFYDTDDIVAYPLKGLFKKNKQNQSTPKDVEVSAGFPLASHIGYWKNKKMAKKISKHL